MTAIFRRELRSYFNSVTGYAFAAFLLLFTGIYTMGICLAGGYTNYEYVLGNMAFIFLLIVPIVTMKVFAEEKKQKTDQLLYALPLGMTKIVLGKYLALLVVFAVPMVIVAVYPLLLSMYGTLNLKVVYCTVIGFILLGAALLSIGTFISSLTESQPIAGGLTFLVLLINYLSSSIASAIGVGRDFIESLDLFARLDQFVYGIFDVGNVIFYLTVTAFFLFLTVQSLEKRRWS